ncbi:nuclear transport factor 2 family protein [Nocardioides jensenii]|uniref:nuclear transport factor 2 family protein n=1 Tax=Nocardioides jensenii TaxID=1843 RepID=UPI0008369DF3|nr:nuclear transport factor 2 family protein [Nocardioides jensenii]
MDLQELSDRQEITDLLTRYTRAVDTRSYDDLAAVFTADAVLDYRASGGPIGTPAEVVPWIEQGLAGFQRTQHILGQLAITFDGPVHDQPDRAHVTAYFTNPMVVINPDGSEGLWEVGGYYHHDLVRLPDGWRSTKIVDDVQWTRGF